ncbi:MAG: right-handed parallel beta-helix repeat-containing protein [Solirubrobacterales bacterium]|nr:right-handed parallel beta-helix repeat-containing protein [Solirubrobacterales bacterium]
MSLPDRWLLAVLLAAAAVLAVALIVLAPSARASAGCDLFASPSGSATGTGSYQNPFRTVQEVVDSLHAGQTGCLDAGTYYGHVRIANTGQPGAPLTLTAAPGQTATVYGRMEIVKGANYVTVTGLTLDGANDQHLQSPIVDSNHDTFSYDDVTDDHTGICFGLGDPIWGWATGTLITHSRIHDCGQMNSGDNYQHGLYIGAATDTRIEWNLIYDNAARGIQLYPDAEYTTIDHNIIDGNGEGILVSGDEGKATNHTNIYDNIVSDATVRHDVESWWPVGNPVGVDNTAHNNCLWGGRQGPIDTSDGGLSASQNLNINPQYVNANTHDYEMSPNSPCLALVGDVQAAVDGTTPVQPAPAAMDATRQDLIQEAHHNRHAHKKHLRRRRRHAAH